MPLLSPVLAALPDTGQLQDRGPPSAVGGQGGAGRRRCRLAMYLRDKTLTPIIRYQVPVRGDQCRKTKGMDDMKRVGLMLYVAGSMSLRGNDFPHRSTPWA